MGAVEKTLVVVGPDGAGKAMTTGCMLFKYGGIDTLTMQRFQDEKIRTYDEATKNLKSLKIVLEFYTPKSYHVTILDVSAQLVDCAILVLSADSALGGIKKALSAATDKAKKVIVVVNKMDEIDWSEEKFQEIVTGLGTDIENIPIIPISAKYSDNVVEKSSKSRWYAGWKKAGKTSTTLLEALDVSLQS